MPYINFREGKIHYESHGAGRAVALVHGFLGSIEVWKYIVPELAKRYRIILIDLPGHGSSDNYGYTHKMELMADAIKAVMNHLLLRRYVVIGHSMGGYAALAFAEKHPDNLRGLVLFHSTSFADNEQKIIDRNKAIKVAKRSKEKYLKESLKKLFYPPNIKHHPELLTMIKQIANSMTTQGITAALEGMKIRKNSEVVLHFSNYPVLFIAGKQDVIIPNETNKEQWVIPKDHSLVLLENSAHMGFYEEPEMIIKGLLPFLKHSFAKLEDDEDLS